MKNNKLKPLESQIQKAVLEWLQYRGVLAFKKQSGMIFIKGNKKTRAIKMGMKGVSDIVGCLRGGRFLAVEVKREGGRVTADQLDFISKVRELGGVAVVVHSVEELERELKNLI